MKLTIRYKDRDVSLIVDENDSVKILKKQLENQTKIPFVQQEIFYKVGDKKMVLNDDDLSIKQLGLPAEAQLSIKNLGKQIRWDYVFYIEYLGPILIMPLFYLLGDSTKYTSIQSWALILTILHYAKREYQTAFVHVFSHHSMPFKRVFINCLHYWVFFALLNAIQLYIFPTDHTYAPLTIYLIVGCWLVFQFCNYKCHLVLAGFRRKDKSDEVTAKKRGIPYGWGFGLVSCANYLWEALGWIAFSLLTRSWTAYLFTAFSIYQMAEWALKKHRNYRKEFGDKYPRGRKAMFPFIL